VLFTTYLFSRFEGSDCGWSGSLFNCSRAAAGQAPDQAGQSQHRPYGRLRRMPRSCQSFPT